METSTMDRQTASAKIEQYTAGLDYKAFAADDKTVDAVLRNVEIISEAMCFIPDSVTARWPAIPWAQMRALGNVIARRYFAVDRSEIWSMIVSDLPPLTAQLNVILESDDETN